MPASKAFTIWTEAVANAKNPSDADTGGVAPLVLPPSRAFTVWTNAVRAGTLGSVAPPLPARPSLALPKSQAFTIWTRSALAAPPAAAATSMLAGSPATRPSIFDHSAEEEEAAPLTGLLVRWFAIAAAVLLVGTGFYQLSTEVRGLKEDKSSLTSALGVSEEANRGLEADLGSVRSELRTTRGELSQTRSELARYRSANRSLELVVGDLKKEVVLWKANMQEATDKHAMERKSLEEIIAGNKTRIAKLDAEVATTKTMLGDREKKIAAKDKELADMQGELARAVKTIGDLEAATKMAIVHIGDLEAKVEARAEELAVASAGMTTMKSENAAREKALADELAVKAAELKSQQEAAAAAAAKAEARIADLEAELEAARENSDSPPTPE